MLDGQNRELIGDEMFSFLVWQQLLTSNPGFVRSLMYLEVTKRYFSRRMHSEIFHWLSFKFAFLTEINPLAVRLFVQCIKQAERFVCQYITCRLFSAAHQRLALKRAACVPDFG